MLHYLLTPLSDGGDLFNLFRYISFRTGGALLTSLLIFFLAGRRIIDWLRVKQKRGQPIREDGPQSHIIQKAGTPTMGGVLIVGAILISTMLWAELSDGYIWVVMLVTLAYAMIGFLDDYLKVTRRTSGGASARVRLLGGAAIGIAASFWIALLSPEALQYRLAVPFFKDVLFNLGFFFPVFGMLVVVGTANAVNLTDGLDGLAIVPAMIAIMSYGLIAYFVGNAVFSEYLALHFVPGVGEISVFVGAMIGAGLGFLWYNAPPAMVFMGDTGSLALGGALGAIAVATKHEVVLLIIGGLFVLETVSVFLQVASFKLTGRRVFRMAPIHHHFEHKGWQEPTIVIRFWIIAIILALIGLSTLKLR